MLWGIFAGALIGFLMSSIHHMRVSEGSNPQTFTPAVVGRLTEHLGLAHRSRRLSCAVRAFRHAPLRDTEGLRENRSVHVGGFNRHEWITQQPTVAMGPTAAERLVGLVVVSCLDRLQGRPCGYSGNDLT